MADIGNWTSVAKELEQRVGQEADVTKLAEALYPSVKIGLSFLENLDRVAQATSPVKLDADITEDEWNTARARPRAVIDRWFYEDVGVFVAPGGTGKTTLLLFQMIHLVLGLDLFGHTVMAPGPVVLLTAEDSRETLVARLRQMCHEMGLTPQQVREVRESILITDMSGKGIKLTKVEKDVVVPSIHLDKLVVEVGLRCPSLLVIDPMVSFGIGESRINDAEQGMIDAARRIRNVAKCGVIYVHHTGKANAREETLDQYSGRGGSALADGARMVHVLQRMTPEKWTEATGDVLDSDDAAFVLARPKMTWCPPQPNIYVKRRGFTFTHHDHIGSEAGAAKVNNIADDKVFAFLKAEWLAGKHYTQNTLQDAKVLPQNATRQAVRRLLAAGRLIRVDSGSGGRGGAHHFLRLCEMPVATP